MGKLIDVLKLPEPDRTKAIVALDNAETYGVFNPNEAFNITFQGKPLMVHKGYKKYPVHVAVHLLHKLGGFSNYGETSRTLSEGFEYLTDEKPGSEKEVKTEKPVTGTQVGA